MIATSFRSTPAAAAATAALALAGAVAALAGSSTAHASLSSAPCNTSVQLAKQELRTPDHTLVGKLYVFDEGRNLCAVTTSVGTSKYGIKKLMSVTLTVGAKTETDSGRYSLYAGRIRLPNSNACFTAQARVTLDGGATATGQIYCPPWRHRAQV